MANSLGKTFQRNSVDALPIVEASVDAIDLDKVAAHLAQALARGRFEGPTTPEDYLDYQQCVVDFEGQRYPTLAGILCFGRTPQRILPYAVVDIGHYRGVETLSFEVVHLEKSIGGTIFDQLRRVETYLWTNTHHGMTLSDSSLERVEVHAYPRAVIRELVVNLLAHRDYTLVGSAARVTLFRNRIEWASPGGLPPGVTIDNLLDIQSARNPVLLQILYQAGLVEAFGQGLDTVVSVLRDEGLSPPSFRDVGAAFLVSVVGRDVEALATTPITPITDAQHRVIAAIRARGEIGFNDLCSAVPDRSYRSVQEDIRDLIATGVVERIGKTRAVRYRLAAPGATHASDTSTV